MLSRVGQIENSLQQGLCQTPGVGCQSWQNGRVLLIAYITKYMSLNVCFCVRFLFNQRSKKKKMHFFLVSMYLARKY